MQQLHTDLWIADAPLRFMGLELGARMTVVRLSGGRLVLHSPIALTPALVAEVRSLGDVVALVAPNRLHHMFVGPWARAFPEARVYVAPGLPAKRPDLANAEVLSETAEPVWAGVLEQVVIEGLPMTNEVVFFHRSSGTLIVTDLAFHIGPSSAPLTRLAFRASGAYGRLAPTWVERLGIRDRAAFRASLERVFAWPFDRVVMAHGAVVEAGGRAALWRGYAWALPVALSEAAPLPLNTEGPHAEGPPALAPQAARTLVRVVPNERWELVLEFSGGEFRLFSASTARLEFGWSSLAYPQGVKHLTYTPTEVCWGGGKVLSAAYLYANSVEVSGEALRRQSLRVSYHHRAPTEVHATHHVFSVFVCPFDVQLLRCGESIAGGHQDVGGTRAFSAESLLDWADWREHFERSGCAWAVPLVEALSGAPQALADRLVAEVCARSGAE